MGTQENPLDGQHDEPGKNGWRRMAYGFSSWHSSDFPDNRIISS